MRQKFKTPLLFSSIAIVVASMAIGVSATVINRNRSFNYAAAGEHSITLNGSNAPTELTSSYQANVQTTIRSELDNPLSLNLAIAKASSGNFVDLGKNGYLYNFDSEDGRIKGISAITATLASGSLKLSTTNSEISGGGAFLGDAQSITSGTRFALANPARYFQLKAGNSGAVIQTLKIEYTCDGDATPLPSQNIYDVEDFESYTATGVGYDASNGLGATTNLRAGFYSAYYGGTDGPLQEGHWSKMGSSDYLVYNGAAGRNDSKTGLFKVNNGNNFRYVSMKTYLGVNSVVGKGNTLSVWMHGPYKSDQTAGTVNLNVTIFAVYSSKLATSGTDDGASAEYVVEAGSDWLEYTLDLDPTKNVYGFGVYIKKSSDTFYLPVDDVKVYSESPYPATHPTSVEINEGLGTALTTGATKTLTTTVLPNNAKNKAVNWSSNNTSVATVSSAGVVTAVAPGEATITATTQDGGLTDIFEIAVRDQLDYFGGTFYKQLTDKINLIVAFGAQGQCDIIICNKSLVVNWSVYNASTKQFTVKTSGDYNSYTLLNVTGTYDDGNNRLVNVNCTGNASALVSNATIPAMGSGADSVLYSCNLSVADMRTTFKRTYLAYGSTTWQENTGDHTRFAQNTTNYVTGTYSMRVNGWADGNVGLSLQSELSNTTFKSIGFWVYNPGAVDVTYSVFVFKETGLVNGICPNASLVAKAGQWTYLCTGLELKPSFVVGTDTLYNFKIMMGYKDIHLSFDEIALYV